MAQPILLTAAREDAEEILALAGDASVLHTPLEVYQPEVHDEIASDVFGRLDAFENIVYASRRNARFFLEQLQSFTEINAVKSSLNLAFDKSTFQYLEEQGIAAVHPQNGSKAIDAVEMMMRLQRLGKTLYPCGGHEREDLPGLLEELDIPVTELAVFTLEGPSEEALSAYQKEVQREKPDTIIFHSRRSVNRTLAAFPDLAYENVRIISADKGITKKLEEKGYTVDDEAKGNWQSVAEVI